MPDVGSPLPARIAPLALIALASMAFAAWMFYRLTASVQQLAIGLAQLSARLENRPCLLDHERGKSG